MNDFGLLFIAKAYINGMGRDLLTFRCSFRRKLANLALSGDSLSL
jgi:hypothetical protein